ncbi:response regulator [Variovorax sp. J22R133]|uniref:response regulator n=1 Tax=Variovorax brevis TaxID=3053503 RepID=UPI0025766392|nr:response regulator [Variovorax sp. J22R133]MDM0116560.1 response regulator [Variovorax sp. J22R133]
MGSSGPKILYVEDNEYNRKIVRQLLKRSTCTLIEAEDGETGLTLARQDLPDLILMDVQLPRMSGLDATRVLTTEDATKHIPIIVITSYALSGDREKALQAGACNYLAKPYSPSELLAMVKHYLPGL